MSWTSERVLALAPDNASAKSGRELANLKKWSLIACKEDTALWGECQGSGKLPYQTQIDLSTETPTFKCSCPSRKFPCKHGLGLLLLYAQDKTAFKSQEAPAWVSEWLEKRNLRAATKVEKAAVPKESDKTAQEKRFSAREKKVAAGLNELSLWLRDLIRTGLASAPGKPLSFWETAAKRLIDAQAPGAARRVQALPDYLYGEDWSQRFLEQLALLHLLAEAYKRLESLNPETQADVRSAIGFPVSQDVLMQQPAIQDTWRIYGQVITEEDRLRARRTYLVGQHTGHTAMLLEFAYAQQSFEHALSGFECWEGEMVFYPGNVLQRASLREGSFKSDVQSKPILAQSFAAVYESYSDTLAKNPWTLRIPVQLAATPEPSGGTWTLRDQAGKQLVVDAAFAYWPALIEESGGQTLHLFGEWDGKGFLPLLSTSPVSGYTLLYPHGRTL